MIVLFKPRDMRVISMFLIFRREMCVLFGVRFSNKGGRKMDIIPKLSCILGIECLDWDGALLSQEREYIPLSSDDSVFCTPTSLTDLQNLLARAILPLL